MITFGLRLGLRVSKLLVRVCLCVCVFSYAWVHVSRVSLFGLTLAFALTCIISTRHY